MPIIAANTKHYGIVEGDNIGHHAGDQKPHKVESHKAETKETAHKAGSLHVQTRRDTTDPIPGEPDYLPPEAWPAHHIEQLEIAKRR